MPAWMFLVVGLLFGIFTLLLLGLAFIGHVDVGADSMLTTLALAVGSIHFGMRSLRGHASRP
jgi:hypothetical protein